MKNITYSNTSAKIEVIGFSDAGEIKVLATFGDNLTGLEALPYTDAARQPLAQAMRDASAWLDDQGGAEGLNVQLVTRVIPGATITENIYINHR